MTTTTVRPFGWDTLQHHLCESDLYSTLIPIAAFRECLRLLGVEDHPLSILVDADHMLQFDKDYNVVEPTAVELTPSAQFICFLPFAILRSADGSLLKYGDTMVVAHDGQLFDLLTLKVLLAHARASHYNGRSSSCFNRV